MAADLTGNFVTVPTEIVAGSRPKVVLNVRNIGDSRANGSIAVSVYAVAEGAAFDPASSQLLTTYKKGVNIAAGRQTNLNINTPLVPATAIGDYRLVAVIDSQNRFNETSESNNIAQSEAVAVVAPTVDLVPSITMGSNVQIIAGRSTRTTARITVTNDGNTAVSRNQFLNLAITGQPVGSVESSDEVLLSSSNARINVSNLAPGASRTVNVPLVFPATLDAQDLNLVLEANGSSSLVETDTLNNVTLPQIITIQQTTGGSASSPGAGVSPGNIPTSAAGSFGATPGSSGGSPLNLTPPGIGGLTPTTGFINLPSSGFNGLPTSGLIPVPALSGRQPFAGSTAIIPSFSSPSPFVVSVPALTGISIGTSATSFGLMRTSSPSGF
jgi:hypothetical protein